MSSTTSEWIDSQGFRKAVSELIRLAACELPADVEQALAAARGRERAGSTAELTLALFLQNIALAKEKQAAICQDTGLPIFFIRHPEGLSQRQLIRICREEVVEATKKQYLRHNAVDPVTGKNSGTNLGEGFPAFYFTEGDEPAIEMALLLKGGGSENVSAQYSLPYSDLSAERDLEGVRRVCLDAVRKAEGKGCAPGILGICIGGDRGGGYAEAKHQLLRRLDDVNPDPALAELEVRLLAEANQLGIGPLGLGGNTTLLGVKVGKLHCVPASFFVTISYMCWVNRRRSVRIAPDGAWHVTG
ncbi:MAG: fumarate hydratase [Deltaproteobacteria bacterium]|nr:fumarate hydratase [Deltaproteobacteria bacterium]